MEHKNVFASALTTGGLLSRWDDVFQALRRVYLLEGPSFWKSLFLRLVGLALEDRGFGVVYCRDSADHLSLEGIVVDVLGAGVVAKLHGTPPPGVVVTRVPVGGGASEEEECLPEEEKARPLLAAAGAAWRELAAAHRGALELEAARRQAEAWARETFRKPLRLRRFFAGTLAPEGPVDYLGHLARGYRRCFLSGPPGTGRPVLEELLFQALGRHYEVEVFYSYLEPEAPILVLVPEAGVALIDGTCGFGPAPQPDDVVWDLGPLLGGEVPGAAEQEARAAGLVGAAREVLLHRARSLPASPPPSSEEVASFVRRLLAEAAHALVP